MAKTTNTKAKKTNTKPATKKVSEKTTSESKIKTNSKIVSKPKVKASKKNITPELQQAVNKVVEQKIVEESQKISKELKADDNQVAQKKEVKKVAFYEAGIKSVSFIALVVVVLAAILILLWEFALPSRYKLSTVVSDSKIERIFLRADPLKADDNYDVAVIEPCNLAIRFDKNKYTANVGVTKNGNFGVYKDPFNRIFDNKDLDVYEFSLTEKTQSQTQKAAVVACLDAGLTKNLNSDNLDDITNTLSKEIPNSFTKVANELNEIPFFNEPSTKYFGKNLFRKIRLVSEQAPNLDINNSFFAFDNRLLFVAAQNSPDNIEFQVNSLNPSESSFDVKTTLNEYKEADKALTEKLNKENSVLKLDQNKDWKLDIELANFGNLEVNLSEKNAPKSVENFVRLAYRGYFDETIFHRIVKRNNFNVIQGGDKENKNGTGGRSSFYINESSPGLIVDEIWKVAPEFSTSESGENTPTNTPEFRNPDLYKDYDNKTGLVTFPKGSIAMATTGQPDSASSQFFVMLKDTQLPAEYTIFATISESSFGTLDKIFDGVSPTPNTEVGEQSGLDGVPNKEIKINSVKIKEPQI